MNQDETGIMQNIRLALGQRPDVLIFRNNVGALKDQSGRLIRYGLCDGSSDLIGFAIRNGIAVFVAIEVKAPGSYTDPKRLEKQKNFLRTVRAAGGLAGFARSVEDAQEIVNGKQNPIE